MHCTELRERNLLERALQIRGQVEEPSTRLVITRRAVSWLGCRAGEARPELGMRAPTRRAGSNGCIEPMR